MKIIVGKKKKKIAIVKNNIAIRIAGKVSRYIDESCHPYSIGCLSGVYRFGRWFVQIVGVCAEEIKAAQHWNGAGVIDLLKTIPV